MRHGATISEASFVQDRKEQVSARYCIQTVQITFWHRRISIQIVVSHYPIDFT